MTSKDLAVSGCSKKHGQWYSLDFVRLSMLVAQVTHNFSLKPSQMPVGFVSQNFGGKLSVEVLIKFCPNVAFGRFSSALYRLVPEKYKLQLP